MCIAMSFLLPDSCFLTLHPPLLFFTNHFSPDVCYITVSPDAHFFSFLSTLLRIIPMYRYSMEGSWGFMVRAWSSIDIRFMYR